MPSSLWFFDILQFILKVFRNFAEVILTSASLVLYELKGFGLPTVSSFRELTYMFLIQN